MTRSIGNTDALGAGTSIEPGVQSRGHSRGGLGEPPHPQRGCFLWKDESRIRASGSSHNARSSGPTPHDQHS
jgi:hypothetical protein